MRKDNEHSFTKNCCKLCCCKSCTYCTRAFTKENCKSLHVRLLSELQIKVCETCFLCQSIVFCKTCNKCPTCCLKSACRGQTSKLLANLAGPGCWSESSSNPQRGLHPPLLDPAEIDKVTHSHKPLCKPSQEPLPARGVTSAYGQKRSRAGSLGFFNQIFLVPKPNNKWRPILDLRYLKQFLKAPKF